MRGFSGSGSAAQNGQGIAVVQVVEGLQRYRVVLAQCRAQCVGVPGAGLDRVLVSPGEHLDRLGLGAVAGHRAVVVSVGADQVGQQLGIARIGFRAGDLMAVAIAGDGERVGRVHPVPGRAQRLYPQAAIRFDADHHLAGFLDVGGHQLVWNPPMPGSPSGSRRDAIENFLIGGAIIVVTAWPIFALVHTGQLWGIIAGVTIFWP